LARPDGGVVNAKELASKAFWAVKEREPRARRLVNAARREALIARLRTQAAWQRSSVDVDIDPTAVIGPDIAVTIDPGTTSALHLGPGTALAGQSRIHLRGGHISIDERTSIRQHTVLNVSGALEIGPDCILSYGTVVHCAERITLGQIVGIAEYVTLVDSTHFLTDIDTRHYDNVRTKPLAIGRNTWLCPKSTVTMGVTIGDYCVVGSGVTVTQDVPDGHSVGQGQTLERRRRLPWEAAVSAVQVPA
jgi:acetyltransferase-like isoleucine patch superfamily enzyme